MKRYSEYKDSGVKWIGEIPGHWKIMRLRAYLSMYSEKNHPDKQLLSVTRESGVIVRNTESKEENHNYIPDDLSGYKLVRIGDFAINKMKSWQGSYGVSNFEGIVSPAYYVCKLKFPYKDFFSNAIRCKAYIPFFTQYSKGIRVDQWDLSPIALKNIPFFEPPLPEQEAIVTYLDSKVAKIDEYISIAEKKIAALEELKQTIIAEAVTRGIHKDVPMKDSGVKWIGMIPEHWNTPRIKSVAIFNPSKSTNNYQKVGYAPMDCIRCGNITAGIIDYKKLPTGLTYFENEDIVVAKVTPCFENGNIAIAKNLHNGCAYGSSELFVFRCYGVENRYLFYYMQDEKFKHKCCSTMTGTGGLKRISSSFIRNAFIPLPPLSEQQEIVTYLDSKVANINQLCQAERSQIEKLKEYKQRLISDVVTGKVKVTND